ncbi:MAG: GAF domain-containing protein [Acidobacteriales bacterium]|nr:GAF domain-containing protein [Terriglobales bacterium]
MDKYPTLNPPGASPSSPGSAAAAQKTQAGTARHATPAFSELADSVQSSKDDSLGRLRFPAEDAGRSLAESAQRDFDATLQLLAERAQYITGASGAAIALADGGEMICRASAGPSAPKLGVHLQVHSGLTGESVRSREMLRCDDAELDSRVNRESCRRLGIASVMVIPLFREQQVAGVFELFSGRTNAFEERDVSALRRLAEMVQTASEHAEAAKRASKEILSGGKALQNGSKRPTGPPELAGLRDSQTSPVTVTAASNQGARVEPVAAAAAGAAGEPGARTAPESAAAKPQPPKFDHPAELDKPISAAPELEASGVQSREAPLDVKKCSACGFPVSQGRTVCVDCEAAGAAANSSTFTPEKATFLSNLTASREGWLASHGYTVGIVIVVAATVIAVIVWMR